MSSPQSSASENHGYLLSSYPDSCLTCNQTRTKRHREEGSTPLVVRKQNNTQFVWSLCYFESSHCHLKLLQPFLLQLPRFEVEVVSTSAIAVQQQEEMGPLCTDNGVSSANSLDTPEATTKLPFCFPSPLKLHLVIGSDLVQGFPSAQTSRRFSSCKRSRPYRKGRRIWKRKQTQAQTTDAV